MKARSLTEWEIDVLNTALKNMACDRAYPKRFRDGAQSMFDQKMPENFFWISEKVSNA